MEWNHCFSKETRHNIRHNIIEEQFSEEVIIASGVRTLSEAMRMLREVPAEKLGALVLNEV